MQDEATEPVRILSLVHEDRAGSGVFAEVARARSAQLVEWRVDRSGPLEDAGQHDALIVLGGSMHATEDDLYSWLGPELRFIDAWVTAGRPFLGICLGAQLLCRATGGQVRPSEVPEIGWHGLQFDAAGDAVLGHLPVSVTALQWHSYESLPAPGAVALARSPACLQAFRVGDHAWGVQFHPEAVREDVEAWILDHGQSDAGFDARAALEQMDRHIDRWNETGRSIAHRFIDHVEAVKMSAAPRSLTAT